MIHVDEKTKVVDLRPEWKKEMHKYPDPKSSFDLVDLEEAMIEQPKRGVRHCSRTTFVCGSYAKAPSNARPVPTCRRRQSGLRADPSSTTWWRGSRWRKWP